MLHEPKAKRVDKPKQSEQTAEKYEFFVNGIDGSLNRRKMKANEQKGEREKYVHLPHWKSAEMSSKIKHHFKIIEENIPQF